MHKLFLFPLLVGLAALRLAVAQPSAPSSPANCLPAGIRLSTIVEVKNTENGDGQPARTNVSVEQKLTNLGATCNSENKLVDGTGRPIAFYHLIGCWGNPPPNYRELLQKQRNELERLRQEHTVIELTCNPTGIQIP